MGCILIWQKKQRSNFFWYKDFLFIYSLLCKWIFLPFGPADPLLFCECRTKILESEKFFFLSVPKDDAVIKCWNTPSLISHMLHIHILLWCSIYYAWFKLHYKLMHFNTRTFNKVHFIQRTYFAPDNSEKRYLTLKVGFCPYFLLLSFLRHPVPVDYRKM